MSSEIPSFFESRMILFSSATKNRGFGGGLSSISEIASIKSKSDLYNKAS